MKGFIKDIISLFSNTAYIIGSFIIELFLFTLAITLTLLGYSTIVIGIGMPILYYMCWFLENVRRMEGEGIRNMLGAELQVNNVQINEKIFSRETLVNIIPYVVYRVKKFVIAVYSFVIALPLAVLSLALIITPVGYKLGFSMVNIGNYNLINSLPTAFIASLVGIFTAVLSSRVISKLVSSIVNYQTRVNETIEGLYSERNFE